MDVLLLTPIDPFAYQITPALSLKSRIRLVRRAHIRPCLEPRRLLRLASLVKNRGHLLVILRRSIKLFQ